MALVLLSAANHINPLRSGSLDVLQEPEPPRLSFYRQLCAEFHRPPVNSYPIGDNPVRVHVCYSGLYSLTTTHFASFPFLGPETELPRLALLYRTTAYKKAFRDRNER